MFTCDTFHLDQEQMKKLKKWDEEHDCSCKPKYGMRKYVGPIGGSISITFTPTSIGTFIEAKCACGKTIDLSNV